MVLTSPVGTSHVMVSRIGANEAIGPGDSSNYAGTYNFTDSTFGSSIWTVAMLTSCGDTCNVTPGDYRTTKSGFPGATDFTLSFLGLNTAQVNGTWTLTIRDAAAGETGTVTAANLKLRRNCGTPTPPPTPTSAPTPTPTPTAIPGALLDTITGANTTAYTYSLPRSYMGDGWTNNAIPASSTSVKITGLQLNLVSATTQSYTDVVARIQFWNTHNQAATPIFSNPSGPPITMDLGPRNFTANFPLWFSFTLPEPVILPGGPGTEWGITVNYQGNTGAGLVDTDNLTSLLSGYFSIGGYKTGRITTGTAPTFGYYRNLSGRTDFNFNPTDSRRLLGLNAQGIAIVILGTAQGPGTPTPTPPASPSVSPSPTVGETSTPSPITPTPSVTPTPTPIPGTLLDTITGADTTTFTGSAPRTYMGDSWTNNALPGGSTSVSITAVTLYMVSATSQAYSDVVARIQFWNSFNASANPVFTDASGPLVTADLGPLNLTANSFTAIPVTLATPLILPGGPGTNWGFAVNFQGNTGAGLVDTTNLTSMITAHSNARYSTGQITSGTAPAFGYYRNASGRVDFNFNSSDARTLAGLNAQGIGIIIFGTAQGGETPTPSPSPSPCPTPSVSPSATAMATIVPTATPKPTQTPAPTATATPVPEAATKAINLSTRMRVQVGDGAGIGGFIISGATARHVVVRALGPSLNQFGVADALADPVLELHGPSGFTTVINDNWRDTQIQMSVLAPTHNLESGMELTLPPGAYTAVVRGKNNATGVALVEVYDLSQTDGKLGNISTRAFVSTGDNIVIAGMVLSQGSGSDRLVFRGIGPSLAPAFFPASAVLANPTLELRGQDGTLILANDNWQDNTAQAAEITAAGLAPGNSLESAIAISLPSGFYTVLLAGTNNGTGIGVVEIYDRGP